MNEQQTAKERTMEYLRHSGIHTIPKKDLIDRGEYFEVDIEIYSIYLAEEAIDKALSTQKEEHDKEITMLKSSMNWERKKHEAKLKEIREWLIKNKTDLDFSIVHIDEFDVLVRK